jgi:sugar phosphate isomerase/epimerase
MVHWGRELLSEAGYFHSVSMLDDPYLAGEDPIEWLLHVKDRLVHLHAKDIAVTQSDSERGKVTGTPVGCGCGDGVIDWGKVIEICKMAPRDIVFSVECGTVDQAARSIAHLRSTSGG